MFGVDLLTAVLLIGAGALGWLVLSHGWGWVLAKFHTIIANEKAYAVANLNIATNSALVDRMTAAETAIAALKAKVGI